VYTAKVGLSDEGGEGAAPGYSRHLLDDIKAYLDAEKLRP